MLGKPPNIVHVAIVSTFPPRRCGIATYCSDLCAALDKLPGIVVRVAAINEAGARHSYPGQVCWRVNDQDTQGFLRLAEELGDWADVMLIQHEYGIFGGAAGGSLLKLVEAASIPVVTMLHTVLSWPDPAVRHVTDVICERSAAILVPGPRSDVVLRNAYRTGLTKVVQIPHGITEVAQVGRADDRSLLLGFGYLGPNKGVENVLAAMPYLVKRRPRLHYRFVGSQHPSEWLAFGDEYPHRLRRLVAQLEVEDCVEFVSRYVSDAELSRTLSEAAVCVLPYTDAEQAVSGTLARALGAGRAVVATAFRHALEAADHGAIHLVPVSDPQAIAEAVDLVLTDRSYRHRLEERARAMASDLRWPLVARRYEQVLRQAAVAVRQ
jgi:glycosyltransferase involved in cell wall biosynthesis